jgi:hypothetical protein
MDRKAFTTFGAGRVGAECIESTAQPLPEGITRIVEIDAPDGVNPSKLGTFIQRFAIDGSLPEDASDSDRVFIEAAAANFDDPTVALAISMEGTGPGEKMRDRIGASVESGRHPYLVFGMTAT